MVATESPSVSDTCRLSRAALCCAGAPCLAAATAEAARFAHSASPHFHFNLELMNAKTLAEN